MKRLEMLHHDNFHISLVLVLRYIRQSIDRSETRHNISPLPTLLSRNVGVYTLMDFLFSINFILLHFVSGPNTFIPMLQNEPSYLQEKSAIYIAQ